MKNPEDKTTWLIDEEAAQVVRRIYEMSIDRHGTEQIAKALEKDKVLTPKHYLKSKGINRGGKLIEDSRFLWRASTVIKILSMREYKGDIVNFKTYSKSVFKKERIKNDEEDMAIFEGVNEPIIDPGTWEKVQTSRKKIRKRKVKDSTKNMFSGTLVCADCGHPLWFHFNQGNPDITYFNCSNYNSGRGSCSATHYIRTDFLEQVVLHELSRLTYFAEQYSDEFLKIVMDETLKKSAKMKQTKQKELKALQERYREIDRLFEKMYEDNASGKISDDRFTKMSQTYEKEQADISERIRIVEPEAERERSSHMSSDTFISTVRKYTSIQTLTPRIVKELIDKIEVWHPLRDKRNVTQKIKIHYNCVGYFEIPERDKLPKADIHIETRKGVAIGYSPSEKVS